MPPGIFDGIVNILVQQLTKTPIRPHICDPQARMALIKQFVEIVRQKMREIKHEPKDFADVCESLPMIKLKLKKSDLGALADV